MVMQLFPSNLYSKSLSYFQVIIQFEGDTLHKMMIF